MCDNLVNLRKHKVIGDNNEMVLGKKESRTTDKKSA